MTDITLAQRIESFDSYFRSANGVPANARISVPTSEWLELHTALAATQAQDVQLDAVGEWNEIHTMPTCDDPIWLYCKDTNTIDGPVAPNPTYEDSWTHWAYATAPSTETIDAASAAKGGEA